MQQEMGLASRQIKSSRVGWSLPLFADGLVDIDSAVRAWQTVQRLLDAQQGIHMSPLLLRDNERLAPSLIGAISHVALRGTPTQTRRPDLRKQAYTGK